MEILSMRSRVFVGGMLRQSNFCKEKEELKRCAASNLQLYETVHSQYAKDHRAEVFNRGYATPRVRESFVFIRLFFKIPPQFFPQIEMSLNTH
jgi:hypothetical protein